ncbi:jg19663 [Pararge aegeria aegeria]|uniref:Jg19663 protein n=1 Tax=Pararge aegeria aegeria TaxID=348720 RepID=A0A8S4QWZ8_9NEOP|nr:jg19663 [Pararge aegeria aegeria]
MDFHRWTYVFCSEFHLLPAAPSDSLDVVCPTCGCVEQRHVAFPAPWDPNVHRFSELCAPPIATSASRFYELCWTLADNHLRGCYSVTGGVGRARKLAMRRAPGLDDIGGEVGEVDPRVPPARTRTSARFDVNLTVGGLLD